MRKKVFYHPVEEKENRPEIVAEIARRILERIIKESLLPLEKEIPLKIHPGNPGNTSFIKPANFTSIIKFLKEKKIRTYFVETNQAPPGDRDNGKKHLLIARKHGFTQIPFIVADGDDGFDHVLVKIRNGKHFKECKIATRLAGQKQVIVLSHFKGHILSGFGGAIKMLGLGFASGRGKVEMHSRLNLKDGESINWSDSRSLFQDKEFRERSAEYALAASQNKNFIYLNFALNIVKYCDCDERPMKPVYRDLGIFASTDPVAVDKACFDLLAKREGKKPFAGDDIFAYSEKIGLGSQKYQLIKINP